MLLSMLKDLRKDVARRFDLKPWMVFSDASLMEMSTVYPLNLDELKRCQVGDGKARKFGPDFVSLIARYVEEFEIERPQDLVIRTPASKDDSRKQLIEAIYRKVPLDDIARLRDIELEDLLSEVESLVEKGVKLDLDYYVTDHLDEAIGTLGEEDYTEMEIRLVRLKFLCDVTN